MNSTFPPQNLDAAEEAAYEAEIVMPDTIAKMVSQMEKRIEILEQTICAAKSDHIEIPAEIWREGAEYDARNKVHMMPVIRENGEEIRSGSVVCGFGFIHHPWLRLRSNGSSLQITGFRCDCQKFTDDAFCGHCAALVSKSRETQDVAVTSGSAVRIGSELANRQSGIQDIRLTEQTENALGQRVYRGKALCSFNFVHYPELTVDKSGAVVSAICTCGSANNGQCAHCAALKPLVSEQKTAYEPIEILFHEEIPPAEAIVPEAEPLQPSLPEPEKNGNNMTIRFGTDMQTDEPVLWYPNDTNQITHINMGIIGTMGTGKTQFTKSVITQLYRQRRNNPGTEELGILIFDYKGDYNEEKTDFIEASGTRVLKLHRLPFNPFALSDFKRKPQLHVHTAMTFADTLTHIYGLGPIQKTTLVQAILSAYEEFGITADPRSWNRPAPTFAQVYAHYCKGRSPRGDSLTAAMDTIAMFELFAPDSHEMVSLYEMLRGTVVLDMSGYPGDLKNLAVAIILDLFYAQMLNSSHSSLITTEDGGVYRQIKKVIMVDEADNIMSSGLPVLKNIIKEGREFGVGMVLSTQFLDHFRGDDEDYRKYMKTWVVHNVENLKRSDVEYVFQLPGSDSGTEQLYQRIKQLEKHRSMVRIGTGAPVYIQDLPFFQIAEDTMESYLVEEASDVTDPE